MLRARAMRGPNDETAILDRAAWTDLMIDLTRAQLDFEAVTREITENKAFAEDKHEIAGKLEIIHGYLKRLISEFEDEPRKHPATESLPASIPLRELRSTGEFMQKYRKGSLFDQKLCTPMNHLEKLLLDVPDLTQ